MNETQRKLLDKGIIVLPEEIEHETYEYVLEALLERAGQLVWMYCKGDGGDSRSALAMVDLIGLHGNVVGLLVGEANSSHVTVWASCQTRYVSPHGAIGVHKVAWNSFSGRADSHNMRLVADEFDATEAKTARVLEAASNKGWDWWLKLIQQTGSSGVRQFDAEAIIRMEMALPIAACLHPFREDSPRGEKVENGFLNAMGALKDEPVVTPEKIEVLKGLGYRINRAASVTANDVTFSSELSVVREWTDGDGVHVDLIAQVGDSAVGWILARQDAEAAGLVDPATGDSPRGENSPPPAPPHDVVRGEDNGSDLDARLRRGGAQF